MDYSAHSRYCVCVCLSVCLSVSWTTPLTLGFVCVCVLDVPEGAMGRWEMGRAEQDHCQSGTPVSVDQG
jgi:hypothetical protein